jgi:NADH-quinone oxidoreductase subunit N
MLTSLLNTKVKTRAYSFNAILAIILLVSSAGLACMQKIDGAVYAFNNMVVADKYSELLILLFCLTGVLAVLVSYSYLKRRGIALPEYFSMLLFAISGMMFMVSASDLIIFYIGLEILSIALYVMAAMDSEEIRSTEAGIKYFLMSVFASAFLLFGIAFVFGATGGTSLEGIQEFTSENIIANSWFLYIGLLLILAGIAFKISLVPFHSWTPDVYQGAPLSVTAIMSTGPKIASFAFLFKLFYQFQNAVPYPELVQDIVVFLAVITMVVGNLLALNQEDIKRMLAFSSITHMGYVLTAFASRSDTAVSAALFYFVSYVFMNMGLFAVLSGIAENKDKNLTVENFKGLSVKRPGLALLLLVFLFSLAGIPPLIGFAAKFLVFSSVIKAQMYTLAVIGILNSAVSAYYYLRIIVNMYLKAPEETPENSFGLNYLGFSEWVSIGVCFAAVLLLGIQPAFLIDLVSKAVI